MVCIKRMDVLRDAEILISVADEGSISAAARRKGLSQPAVSRAVARVERRLGVSLLDRGSRRLRLTDAGEWYVSGARRLLREAGTLEATTASLGGRMGGRLRVSLPPGLGHRRLVVALVDWSSRHPGVHLELILETRLVDLVRDDVDIAIRLGPLPDSALLSRRIGRYRHLVVASPNYLKMRGAPDQPSDLRSHSLLGMQTVGPNTAWPFTRGRKKICVQITPTFVTNDGEALVAAAAAGLGITVATDFLCKDELMDGRLVQLLADWSLPSAPITGLCTRAAPPAARALLRHLAKSCESGLASGA